MVSSHILSQVVCGLFHCPKEGFHTFAGVILSGPLEITITGVKKFTRITFPFFNQELDDESFRKKGWGFSHISAHQPREDGLLTSAGNVAEESWIFLLDGPQVDRLLLDESHQEAVKKFYGLRNSALVEIIGQNL
jgi:hypothetical protein